MEGGQEKGVKGFRAEGWRNSVQQTERPSSSKPHLNCRRVCRALSDYVSLVCTLAIMQQPAICRPPSLSNCKERCGVAKSQSGKPHTLLVTTKRRAKLAGVLRAALSGLSPQPGLHQRPRTRTGSMHA